MAAALSLTRVGCLKVVANEGVLPEDEREPAHEQGETVYDELVALLNASPIVADEPFVPDYDGFVRPGGTDELHFHRPISFRAHWPMKNQEHMLEPDRKIEDFELSYDGSIFWVTVNVDDGPLSGWQSFSIGREGSRILQSIFANSESFRYEILGPYSMFTACYVAMVDDGSSFDFGRSLERDHLNWETLVTVSNADQRDGIILGLWAPTSSFYRLMEERDSMQREIGLLDVHFERASSAYSTLVHRTAFTPPAWSERRAARASIRSEIALAYACYASAEGSRGELADRLHTTRDQFARHPSLQDCLSYADESIRQVTSWDGQHIVEGLQFLSEEARSNRLESATVVAPLAGAAVGAAATALGILLTR